MIWLRRILALILITVGLVTVGIYLFAKKQGRLSANYSELADTKVTWDKWGVPTIEAKDWHSLLEAQGFVVASERLFQMDLMRRSASGRLSEWFGNHPSAIEWDENRRHEGWASVAKEAVARLEATEKANCDAYANGVNRFMDSNSWRWGIEYVVLMQAPERWKCEDTYLVFLTMVDDLTRTSEREAWATSWNRDLPKEWFSFLFPSDHPWNKPLFGKNPQRLKVPSQKLEPRAIDDSLLADGVPSDTQIPGSNSWFWSGKTGAFLANDPHLGMTVPQIWYANRLRLNSKEWVVGVTIPGLPGVVLGRNPSLSWAFTNAMEDVDDILEEEISSDGKLYVASIDKGGKKKYQPIRTEEYEIKVRGAESVKGVARFTHRGPLLQFANLGENKWYSKQWLGFFPDRLFLPTMQLNLAKDWESANKALDLFRAPAQNIIFADNKGNVGYRMSGSGILKKRSSLVAVNAVEGEWNGFAPPSERKRQWFVRPKDKAFSLATANQRIYVGDIDQYWSSDLRVARIREVLESSPEATQQTMAQLQLDTHSRYLKLFTDWLIRHSSSQEAPIQRLTEKWKAWNGEGKKDPEAFALALDGHRYFTQLILGQVRKSLLKPENRKISYAWKDQNAWLVYLLETEGSLEAFGLKPELVAHFILKRVAASPANPGGYAQNNRWMAQHPMASAVPLLGSWLKLEEHAQWGFEGLVRVERERFGASMRAIWNVDEPLKSTWVFPVGQSGHVASGNYKDFRTIWFAEESAPVFPSEFTWDFE